MRRYRSQHFQVNFDRFLPGRGTIYLRFQTRHLIHQLHQTRNDGVELEGFEIIGHHLQGLMYLAAQYFFDFCVALGSNRFKNRRPDAAQPALYPIDTAAAPRATHIPASKEHQESADRIRPISLHEIIGRNHIAAALRHLFGILAQHHALVAQLDHGFRAFGNANIPQGFVEETRIHQVHVGVFDAAGISIHWHPVVILRGVEGALGIIRTQVAQMVPGRTHKGIHRIGIPFSIATAHRALGKTPGRVQLQRGFPGRLPFHVIG